MQMPSRRKARRSRVAVVLLGVPDRAIAAATPVSLSPPSAADLDDAAARSATVIVRQLFHQQHPFRRFPISLLVLAVILLFPALIFFLFWGLIIALARSAFSTQPSPWDWLRQASIALVHPQSKGLNLKSVIYRPFRVSLLREDASGRQLKHKINPDTKFYTTNLPRIAFKSGSPTDWHDAKAAGILAATVILLTTDPISDPTLADAELLRAFAALRQFSATPLTFKEAQKQYLAAQSSSSTTPGDGNALAASDPDDTPVGPVEPVACPPAGLRRLSGMSRRWGPKTSHADSGAAEGAGAGATSKAQSSVNCADFHLLCRSSLTVSLCYAAGAQVCVNRDAFLMSLLAATEVPCLAAVLQLLFASISDTDIHRARQFFPLVPLASVYVMASTLEEPPQPQPSRRRILASAISVADLLGAQTSLIVRPVPQCCVGRTYAEVASAVLGRPDPVGVSIRRSGKRATLPQQALLIGVLRRMDALFCPIDVVFAADDALILLADDATYFFPDSLFRTQSPSGTLSSLHALPLRIQSAPVPAPAPAPSLAPSLSVVSLAESDPKATSSRTATSASQVPPLTGHIVFVGQPRRCCQFLSSWAPLEPTSHLQFVLLSSQTVDSADHLVLRCRELLVANRVDSSVHFDVLAPLTPQSIVAASFSTAKRVVFDCFPPILDPRDALAVAVTSTASHDASPLHQGPRVSAALRHVRSLTCFPHTAHAKQTVPPELYPQFLTGNVVFETAPIHCWRRPTTNPRPPS
jgi:hypothetical protein